MPCYDASDVWFPPSLPELPTFSEPPPLTISGEDLARMAPPMPSVDFDPLAELSSSEEDVDEAEAQSPWKKKCLTETKTKGVAQKLQGNSSPKSRPRRAPKREQNKRAAASRAKKAAVIARKSTKKTGSK